MATTKEKSVFETLNAINVNEHTDTKSNGKVTLTYLSWAWAWAEVMKLYPDTKYTIYERETEWGAVNYFTDGRTCWVKTGVTINGKEYVEQLPVMDNRNNSVPLESVTSMDVNKAIKRCITKACALHGLGLYIYAGEDLPEDCNVETAIAEVKGCVSRAELNAVWSKYKMYQKNDKFYDAVKNRTQEIDGNNGK